MRGEHAVDWFRALTLRITPAYAGRTRPKPGGHLLDKDHPRVCGENTIAMEHAVTQWGSPPRMRGEPVVAGVVPGPRRITPAYAGRTGGGSRRTPPRSDHPRVCGENRVAAAVHAAVGGSPPRMRGERPDVPVRPGRHGITPAYAGRTLGCRSRRLFGADHPRVCGENHGPATATRRQTEDHPRVCGENLSSLKELLTRPGSPPRMRGELIRVDTHMVIARITPAYAGRTPSRRSPRTAPQDHPRVCGENRATE